MTNQTQNLKSRTSTSTSDQGAAFSLLTGTAMPARSITALLLGSLMGLACASAPTAKETNLRDEYDGAPKWVTKNCNAYLGEKKKVICGVGATPGMTSISLARSSAEGRARTEIARTVRLVVGAMLKDYEAGTQGGAAGRTSREQHIRDVANQVTDMTLAGTRLEDSWISKTGTFYALMLLDAEAFKDTLAGMRQLDEEVRTAVIERADRAFEELARDVEAGRGR